MSIEENIKIVRHSIEAFNTGDTSNVHQYIGPDCVNRESQSHRDSYRSKLKGPEEFIDTVKNLCIAFPDRSVMAVFTNDAETTVQPTEALRGKYLE